MPDQDDVVFLLDCDNTLLDNDAVVKDLSVRLTREFGAVESTRYWSIFETLRGELGYADYLGALQRYRRTASSDTRLLTIASFLIDYPFESRVYPGVPEALRRLRAMGPTVILSDGDVVFQPRKIQLAGLWNEVDGRVLIYVHKEAMLDDVERHYPARRYVMVDDKLRVLAAMKRSWGKRLTTVFPEQGHYALDAANLAAYPPADITLKHIGDLVDIDLAWLFGSDAMSDD